jgi:hypothetical protein
MRIATPPTESARGRRIGVLAHVGAQSPIASLNAFVAERSVESLLTDAIARAQTVTVDAASRTSC